MSVPQDFDRGELHYKDCSGTFPTAFFTPSSWVAGAVKLRFSDLDMSGLKWAFVGDTSVQNAFEGHPAPHRTYRFGSFKFRMYLEGGSVDTTPPTLATLMGLVLGGLKSPTAISDLAEAGCTTTAINATAHGMDENDLVLFGARGDGGGDGRVSPIEDATTSADAYDLQLALPVAPSTSDVLKNGHQVWADWEAEEYMDFLYIGTEPGSGAADDPWQIQMIGCQSKPPVVGGLGIEEKPYIEFEFMVGDWQFVAYADKASLDNSTARNGENPVYGQQSGSLILQDAGTTTRNTVQGDEYLVSWGYELEMIVDLNNNNRCGGWRKRRAEAPMIGFKSYWASEADMPGLYDDSLAGTDKQVLLQFGHAAQGTVCFYMQLSTPERPLDPSSVMPIETGVGIELNFRGSTGGITDLSTDAKKQEDAALILSFN